nr:lasso peptide biosynthesis B2 protein [uncultured Brevundimonas sp.]
MSSGSRLSTGFAAWRYLAAAWALLFFYRVALAVAPYRLVSRLLPEAKGDVAPGWVQARTRWAIGRTAGAALKATCLPQAMAAQTLLSLQGYSSWIRIGVRRSQDAGIQAHAWVITGDRVVVGDDERLDSFSTLIDLRVPK